MAVNLRRQVIIRWPMAVVVVGAVALVGMVASLHLSKSMALGVALAVPALVTLIRMERQAALQVCVCGAAFFSAAPVKFGQTNVSDLFLVLLVGILVLKRSDELPQPLAKGLLIGLALIVAGGLFGSLFKPSTPPFNEPNGIFTPTPLFHLSLGMSEVVRFTYGTIVIILVIRLCRFSRVEIRRALCAYLLGASVSVVWGFFYPGPDGRSQGLTAHPVALGWTSAIAALVGIGLVLTKGKAAARIGVVTIVLGVIGVSQSGTRSAALMLIAGAVILLLGMRSMRTTTRFVLLGMLAFAIGFTGIVGDSPVANRLRGDQSTVLSNAGRDHIQKESVALVRDHGITGVGLPYIYPPHNIILGVLGSTGVVGLGGLLVVVLALARRLMGSDPNDTMALAVLAAALSVYVCAWVVNVGWGEWFWLPIALVLSLPAPAPAELRVPHATEVRAA